MSTLSVRRFSFVSRFGPLTLITLGSLWLLQSVFAHTGSHGVLIRSLNYDAGTVKAGSTVTENVRLINLSSEPVEVDAQPGCGCTVADVPDKPLAPLHSEIVKLEVDTSGMSNETQQEVTLLKLQTEKQSWSRLIKFKFTVI